MRGECVQKLARSFIIKIQSENSCNQLKRTYPVCSLYYKNKLQSLFSSTYPEKVLKRDIYIILYYTIVFCLYCYFISFITNHTYVIKVIIFTILIFTILLYCAMLCYIIYLNTLPFFFCTELTREVLSLRHGW